MKVVRLQQKDEAIARYIIGRLVEKEAGGVTEIWLGRDADNEAAQALYSATGGQRSDGAFYDFTYQLT